MTGDRQFLQEITEQPEALRALAAYYAAAEGRARLAAVPPVPPALLLGMGASHHAGLLAAEALRRAGHAAEALEAAEMLHAAGRLERAERVLYLSQSGASGEVEPLLQRLPAGAHLTALTNAAHSPLAQRAQTVLPLLAGTEHTVATKTLTNTLALLWLLQEQWAGRLGAEQFVVLEQLAARLAAALASAPALVERWLAHFATVSAFAVIGSGAQTVTARHAAMVIMEWLKLPAVSATAGAFRHGPVEIAQPGLGVVIFPAAGPAQASLRHLAETLSGYGARVLLLDEAAPLDPLLQPSLALLPVQLGVEALARARGLTPGFRHIAKVVTAI